MPDTDNDGTSPRWRTSLANWSKVAGGVSATLTAAAFIWGITLGPLREWIYEINARGDFMSDLNREQGRMQADMLEVQDGMKTVLDQMETTISGLTAQSNATSVLIARVEALETAREKSTAPCLSFARSGHKVSPTEIGGVARISWDFYKLDNCGAPVVTLVFRNGGGAIHRFRDVSILDATGRGIQYEVNPSTAQAIHYTARIPSNEDVKPGSAQAWVTINYPDRPLAAPVVSPEVGFLILPSSGGK